MPSTNELINQFRQLIDDRDKWTYKSVSAYTRDMESYLVETTKTIVETFNKINSIQLEIEQQITITSTEIEEENEDGERKTVKTSTTEYVYTIYFRDMKSRKLMLTLSIDSKHQELEDLKESLKDLFDATKKVYDDKQTY